MSASDDNGGRPRRRHKPRGERPAPVERARSGTTASAATRGSAILAVFTTEVRGLLRDRRALFSAFVLPILLYPVLFLSNSWLQKFSQEMLDSRHVRVAADLSAMPAAEAERLRELLGREEPIEIHDVDATMLLSLDTNLETGSTVSSEERAHVERILAAGGDVLVVARRLETAPHLALRTYYDGQTDLGNEAQRRARHAIQVLRTELQARRIQAVLGEDPARGLDARAIDVASEAEASGAKLGRFLPLILVFVLLAGASYAALAAFAGEREGGTLETLLVQPIAASSIVSGKFLAVLATGVVAIVLNAGSVLVSLQFGVGSLPGTDLGGGLMLDGSRLAVAALLFVPATVFLCAVLCLLCGRARTFREGQQLLLPLLFLAILPVLPATQGDVALDPVLAAVPLCGPALALRDALRGQLQFGLVAWMFVAQCAWALFTLSRLSTLLDAERVVQGAENEAESDARNTQSRVAIRWAIVAVFAVYLIGATLQKWNLVWGLAATLWLLLLPLSILSARGTAARAKESLRSALWLRVPDARQVLGALLVAPILVTLSKQLFEWQQRVLPLPSSQGDITLFQGDPGDHTWAMLLLVALSPAICEEFFFRGALLSGLRRDLSTWRIIAVEMFFFGAVHMSIYRFLPTALLGGVLAILTLRARSLWPAVVLHATYNGLLVLEGDGVLAWPDSWVVPAAFAACGVLGAAVIAWPRASKAPLGA
ncbi:MAG: CPBP family intramembrane metalloprotease [Planctomycetes bacterium]|nr:CPBP family intramembrane metalloprotease [Planctomycetota bacterium]